MKLVDTYQQVGFKKQQNGSRVLYHCHYDVIFIVLIVTPQKDTFHTPTEIFSKDKNDKIKSESECVCSSGSCGGLGGGPHRAEPDHVLR